MEAESGRITIDIPAQMYRQIRKQATTQGRPVRDLILAGVETVLLRGQRPQSRRAHFPLIHSKGPKVALTNEQIYEHAGFP
jgi:hypothetical protein